MELAWVPSDEDLEGLRRPFGQLFVGDSFPSLLAILQKGEGKVLRVSVGDVVTDFLLKSGVFPELCVVDHRTERRERQPLSFPSGYSELRVKNRAGAIGQEAMAAVGYLAGVLRPSSRRILVVSGEEDLLALPLIALLPPDSLLVYGQPGEGVVLVTGNAKKEEAQRIMERMQVVVSDQDG